MSKNRPTETQQPTATPQPTIGTMIVCLPEGLPRESLTAAHLDRHLKVSGTLEPRFWAVPGMWLWQQRELIGSRKGRPTWCAGGPIKLLDLHGMRQAFGVGAGLRHQQWQQVVHGTRPAQPWTVYHLRHLADRTKYPMDRARADFYAQPRINAMRMHNATGYGAAVLRIGEIEMLQAGPMAYQHYTAMTSVCGDALIVDDGHRLAPASDALADRVTYLEQAIRHIDTVDSGQRLIAVTL